ncbi:MAG: phosphate starvation-inducible protein PhoH, partial [Gammaproteobacteria bacterium]|nr:phosphate starvation-inducible protein PhoH [Gammaproteobacteria bacterium]
MPDAGTGNNLIELDLVPADSERMANLCGQIDAHLRQIEQRLAIQIKNRGSHFELSGSADGTEAG